MIVNYDHFYYWRQTTLSVYVYIYIYVCICAHHMYSCINKRSEIEIVSEHNVKKKKDIARSRRKEKAIKQITFGSDWETID